jgi:hypothetical protein
MESMVKCLLSFLAWQEEVQPRQFRSEYQMSEYLFFRMSYIANPKPATPHRIVVVTMMIYSEPKLYTTSTLLKIKEMQRRIIPLIMSFRL